MKYLKASILLISILLLIFLLDRYLIFGKEEEGTIKSNQGMAQLTEKDRELGVILGKDGEKYIVDPDKILSGGPPRDGIPSIDKPKFVSAKEADVFLDDGDEAIVLIYKNEKRAYPLKIMVWHEIVNDFVAGDPLLITYCPLCGTGIAYDRNLDGEAVEFGTSGKLYNSNLVMYDRKTETYWSQIDGKAIVGEMAGQELKEISVDTLPWGDIKTEITELEVLSQDTGFNRSYGRDPYGSYYDDLSLFFPVENKDDRIHPKTKIFGIEIDGVYKAYREDDIGFLETIEDKLAGVDILIKKDKVGIITIKNKKTGEEIVKESGFWFSWYAFHPETELY